MVTTARQTRSEDGALEQIILPQEGGMAEDQAALARWPKLTGKQT